MLSPLALIHTYGTIGVIIIVFLESSSFPFLPGDSLLFTAGFLAGQGYLPIWELYIGVLLAAILGNSFIYQIGRKYGNSVFSRPHSFFLKPDYIEKTRTFFQKYGKSAIIIARFVPIVRTFIPLFAGIGKMPYRTFIIYNIVGAILWVSSMILGGYYIAGIFPGLKDHLTTIALVIIVVSLLPAISTYIKERNKKTQ